MKKYIILLMIFTVSLLANTDKKSSIGFSVNSLLVSDANHGYFSKENSATEVSLDFMYEVVKDISIGLSFENLIDQEDADNKFDYMTANLLVQYSYNLVKSLDLFASLSTGYQKTYFTLNEKSFTSHDVNINPSLGLAFTLNIRNKSFKISYELGYKYQTENDLKFKSESRSIDYGKFSASGIKQKFKVSFLF